MLIDGKGNIVFDSMLKDRKIILFGASTRNKAAIDNLHIKDNILFFVDRDRQKAGQELDGYEIRTVDSLDYFRDCIILSVVVSGSTEILEILRGKGIEECLFYYPEYFDMGEVYQSNMGALQEKKQCRYLHILSNDKFAVPLYEMLEERFCIEEHFLVVAYRIINDFAGILPFMMEKCRKYHNVMILDDVHGIKAHDVMDKGRLVPPDIDCNSLLYSDEMKEMYHCSQKIILHSAFWGCETRKFVYDLTQLYAAKMVWGCFGGDAYFDKDSFEVKEILCKIGGCSTSEGAAEVVKKNYGIKAEIDDAYYLYIPRRTVASVVSKHRSVHILLGHSAFEYVNHMKGFDILQKYIKEDIKIFCPLSYGSDSYSRKVVQKGMELYQEKFIPLLHYMKQEEWFQFLRSIDVAVFPSTRLSGESTLLLLKAASVKVYADLGVVGYMQQRHMQIENIEKIREQSIDEFISHKGMEPYSIDDLNGYIACQWKKFFER